MFKFQQILAFIFVFKFIYAEKMDLSVYYETKGPESMQFIFYQLAPHISDFEEYVDLKLVPFGKASNETGSWQFRCPYGYSACFQNMVHSCVRAHNLITPTMRFINCIDTLRPPLVTFLRKCADYSKVSWYSLDKCINSAEGTERFILNVFKTKAVFPTITSFPTVIFNGVYNKTVSDEALNNFTRVVCRLLKNEPEICKIVLI